MSQKTAFTAQIALHTSTGAPCQLDFGTPTNGPKNWDGKTFVVEKDGLYAITVSYIRDSQVPDTGGDAGTQDDTNLRVILDAKVIGYAWAGEASVARQAASSTFLVPLFRNSMLSTEDWAAEDRKIRRFRHCLLTVFRVAKL